MATNLAIDDKLLRDALKLGKFKTKKETVNTVLQEFIRHKKQMRILDLIGKIDYDPHYDYKAERRRR